VALKQASYGFRPDGKLLGGKLIKDVAAQVVVWVGVILKSPQVPLTLVAPVPQFAVTVMPV